ncbi:Sof1 family domain-containing protein, partial [Toxoplasma gondii MAS]
MDTEGRGERIGHRACYHASCLSPRLSPCCTPQRRFLFVASVLRASRLSRSAPFSPAFVLPQLQLCPSLLSAVRLSASRWTAFRCCSLLAAELRACVAVHPPSPLAFLLLAFGFFFHSLAHLRRRQNGESEGDPPESRGLRPTEAWPASARRPKFRSPDAPLRTPPCYVNSCDLRYEREYTRALNAVKLQKMFAKPLLFCMEGHRDGVKTMVRAKSQA